MHEIILENARRNAALAAAPDPVAGDSNDPSRTPYTFGGRVYWLPSDMLTDPKLTLVNSWHDFARLRFRYDFPFWAATCVVINDKITSRPVPFRLNRPQRRLVSLLEAERRAGRPLRLIMLKARQWGGSTLIQVYFAWIQIIHCRGWNSLICAHVKDTAATIRGMYTKLLANYPEEYWEEDGAKPEFRPFERMTNTRVIPGRDCKVTVCSSENQEATRGQDYALAHLSEVAFWKDSQLHNPADLLRSVVSGIAPKPLSFIAMESTANGTGNFFHREWLRACTPGASDKIPFFVPWHEIEINRSEVTDPEALWNSMDHYERSLWTDHGCTLEAIQWYHDKRLGFPDHRSMKAEYPTDPSEAFESTSRGVFSATDVERLRGGCAPEGERGEIVQSADGDVSRPGATPRFIPSPMGEFTRWKEPRHGGEYIACVDIGGRSSGSDYSVIAVIDRHTDTKGKPEVVGEWRGHTDHDLLAAKASAIGRYYGNALLVIESNSWESSSEGHGRYILDSLLGSYPNLYCRHGGEGNRERIPGFHVNARTKPALVANLVTFVRDGAYTERSHVACDELMHYEALPDGGYSAMRGCHDDVLMTRAIALYIHATTAASVPLLFTREMLNTILRYCIR